MAMRAGPREQCCRATIGYWEATLSHHRDNWLRAKPATSAEGRNGAAAIVAILWSPGGSGSEMPGAT